MRLWLLSLAAAGALALGAAAPARATSPELANGDYPYWKLDYAKLDTTYAALQARARRFAYFRWDDARYCRYPTGWQGPGAYHVGDRFRVRHGWDAGYPWQGPGVEVDHDDEEAFEEAKVAYAREFRRGPFCAPRRHHRLRRPAVVLRRKY